MRLPTGLIAGLLVTGWLTAGCDSASNSTGSAAPTPGPSAPPSDSTTPPQSECEVSRAQWAIGQKASDDLLERARRDAGAKTARFLRPNQAVTLEYAAWRLNLGLDEQDVVKNVSCG
ncbi:MAG TPA: I78 family peptidase inhibitor [Vicinamibacterales bacterium]|nr:I78 family peptidase inhibitor [Vicinamibacterales bacterium]